MDFFEQGDKIECHCSEIIARSIVPEVPRNDPMLGLSIKYKCERNGSAEITKETDPKESVVSDDSNLNLGDTLKSEKLFVLVEGEKRIKSEKITGQSGRHGAQKMNTKNFTYAEITKPFTHIQNAIEKRQREIGE